MIRVTDLTKDYGPRRALHSLSFEARQGEIIGFLGPNGAGKTTTMRILTGYMPPTSGEAIVAGYNVMEESIEVRKRVGYLPETVPLYNEMVVQDFLKFMAELRHIPNPEESVADALNMVGMTERAKGYIGNLSKGMRQRIGLAQALIHRPEVLILDEPSIGLDPGQVVELRKIIREIGRERTVLLSTHILSEAQQICDRVIIINKGKIVVEDTPENLQARLVGGERVVLRVRGDAAELSAKIEQVKGVQRLKSNPDGSLEFEYLPGQDVRPEVAKIITNGGYEMLEMKTLSLSLEDIFLELTKEQTIAPKKKRRL